MVLENLALCRKRMEAVATGAGRTSTDITLVAVTKGVALPFIYKAIDGGVGHIGENRVQEALLKFEPANFYADTKGRRLIWHMIGHLQTNKVKDAVRLFGLIHSVDSLRLAEEIDKQAKKISKVQDLLLEVKISHEATKSGFEPEEALGAVKEISSFKNIRVNGLMTIAPLFDDPEKTRPYFRKLKELEDKINQLRITDYRLPILSMGMTDDFQIAIQEGATMVRIGRGIFGERQK
ncbi:MAG TPA: YggS family pyridoxal phosphate-dependent enzyme [Candidatus Omnitrophica bacterium]|nr:YggS family pyridoxal phosphate-dependent enzyme [Candidatus Omnitrophota bacterium]